MYPNSIYIGFEVVPIYYRYFGAKVHTISVHEPSRLMVSCVIIAIIEGRGGAEAMIAMILVAIFAVSSPPSLNPPSLM